MAGDSDRDEAFVRGFSAWLHAHRERIRLPLVERFGLTDVVVTFQMKSRVTLVATGYPDGLPGDATLRVDEREFPFLEVEVLDAPQSDGAYEICTLDYAPAGTRVVVTGGYLAGKAGALVVAATVNGVEEHRVQLDDGPVVTVPGTRLSRA